MKKLVVLTIAFFFFAVPPSYSHECDCEDSKSYSDRSLSKPIHENVFIANWSVIAVTDSMTFGFSDYKKRLQNSSKYYTPYGWEKFLEALEKSKILETVKTNKMVVTSVVSDVPVIKKMGETNNINDLFESGENNNSTKTEESTNTQKESFYFWSLEFPIILKYESLDNTRSDKLLINVIVKRSNHPHNTDGIGIIRIRATAM